MTFFEKHCLNLLAGCQCEPPACWGGTLSVQFYMMQLGAAPAAAVALCHPVDL